MKIPNNDILALTLANPTHLDSFEFTFPNGVGFVEETGIFRFEPNSLISSHPVSLVLSVGIHGNETGPIEMVNQLVKDILSGGLPLTIRLLVVIGNPVSANQATRFCEVNLNRLFNGAWQHYLNDEEGGNGQDEARRAKRLEQAVSDFYAQDAHDTTRLHYDLHTAIRGSEYEKFAVHPFLKEPVYQYAQFGFLAASGIEAVLLSHQPTTTFSYYSYAAHGANSFTIELGKVHPFGENDLTRLDLIRQSLVSLLESAQLAQGDLSSIKVFAVQDALVKNADDYQLTIADDVKNFTDFSEGYELATSSKGGYRIAKTGDAIVFPNAGVPIGQRAGLVVRPIELNSLAFELTS